MTKAIAQRECGVQTGWGEDLQLFVAPELERRQVAGVFERPVVLRRVQVVFFADGRQREVRVNDEVRATMKVRIAESSSPERGKICFERDIEEIENIFLSDATDDPSAGHITAVKFEARWHLSFDFRYNKAHVRKHSQAAEEFLESAKDSIAAGRTRAAMEALFGAAELAAKAVLLSSLVVGVKTNHRAIHSAFNRWAAFGNVSPRIRDAFNTLSAARNSHRYLASTPNALDQEVLAQTVADLLLEAKRLGATEVDLVV